MPAGADSGQKFRYRQTILERWKQLFGGLALVPEQIKGYPVIVKINGKFRAQ
ncbi:hypothetical protein [Chlorobaculum limnaeum]|uniref:hypothetical protein n=1 Tax=Chlorobaculum limnaeum TaxID=274537 RepID=UPI0012ED6ACD|nr:hypothetical protein [Chlorobaculum limnaeum]